jgi:hypothetical protein
VALKEGLKRKGIIRGIIANQIYMVVSKMVKEGEKAEFVYKIKLALLLFFKISIGKRNYWVQ